MVTQRMLCKKNTGDEDINEAKRKLSNCTHYQCHHQQVLQLLHPALNANGEFGELGALAAGVVDQAD